MAQATLTINLNAICANWRALNDASHTRTAAVVKADAYGLGAAPVARALANAGAETFFVALAEEGVAVRDALGPGPNIFVFSGHMEGDAPLLEQAHLTPLLNSIDQMLRHVERLPEHPFGVQLDTGMNRLGMEPAEWSALRDIAMAQGPKLLMSHLACADAPDHAMNARQLATFKALTDGLDAPRSLAATGGILLGRDYSFDMVRPGIGLYGGMPFVDASPAVSLTVPVIQVREVARNESVGYGNTFVADDNLFVATISAGYADGLIRAMGPDAHVWAGESKCKVLGRISMDLIGIDVTHARETPDAVELLGRHQSIDTLAGAAGTIGYEILTSLGARYTRTYRGA